MQVQYDLRAEGQDLMIFFLMRDSLFVLCLRASKSFVG